MVKVVWNGFAASGTSTLHLNGLTKKDDYILVLQIYLKSTSRWLKLRPPGNYAPVPNPHKKLVLEWIK